MLVIVKRIYVDVFMLSTYIWKRDSKMLLYPSILLVVQTDVSRYIFVLNTSIWKSTVSDDDATFFLQRPKEKATTTPWSLIFATTKWWSVTNDDEVANLTAIDSEKSTTGEQIFCNQLTANMVCNNNFMFFGAIVLKIEKNIHRYKNYFLFTTCDLFCYNNTHVLLPGSYRSNFLPVRRRAVALGIFPNRLCETFKSFQAGQKTSKEISIEIRVKINVTKP